MSDCIMCDAVRAGRYSQCPYHGTDLLPERSTPPKRGVDKCPTCGHDTHGWYKVCSDPYHHAPIIAAAYRSIREAVEPCHDCLRQDDSTVVNESLETIDAAIRMSRLAYRTQREAAESWEQAARLRDAALTAACTRIRENARQDGCDSSCCPVYHIDGQSILPSGEHPQGCADGNEGDLWGDANVCGKDSDHACIVSMRKHFLASAASEKACGSYDVGCTHGGRLVDRAAVEERALSRIPEDSQRGEEGGWLCVLCGDFYPDVEVDGELQERAPKHDRNCPLAGGGDLQ